jgi:hypothetical protein
VHDLTQQVPQLIRSELRLAQAEMTEKGKRAGIGIGMFSAAGVLAFLGLGSLVATAILALAHVLPDWLSALIVGVVLFAVAGGTRGCHRGRQGGPRRSEGSAIVSDERTTDQIEADIERQRDNLAETVDQLSQKLDVKAQAKARVSRLQGRATTDAGKPRAEVLAGAVVLVAMVAGLVWWRRR